MGGVAVSVPTRRTVGREQEEGWEAPTAPGSEQSSGEVSTGGREAWAWLKPDLSPTGARVTPVNGCPATRRPGGPVGAQSRASWKARAIGSG